MVVVDRAVVIDSKGLDELIEVLVGRGYTVVAPQVEDATMVYRSILDGSTLPYGLTDVQDGGTYRLIEVSDGSLSTFVVGPDSPKRWFHPPRVRLFDAALNSEGCLQISPDPIGGERLAFLGTRSCELAAVARQDRVLMAGRYVDDGYAARRDGALFIAFDCIRPGGTCFCASMGTGPKADDSFDLALTEIRSGSEFLVRTGSEQGGTLLEEIRHREATAGDIDLAERIWSSAAQAMGRTLETDGLPGRLREQQDSKRWREVAGRCLACGNCTAVCPTCFCTTVEDGSALDVSSFTRSKRWDSCFSLSFTYIHGAQARSTVASRYRQWLTHKLSGWVEQFGEPGCVGCGRCITWCPVGIDLTEEVLNLQLEPAR